MDASAHETSLADAEAGERYIDVVLLVNPLLSLVVGSGELLMSSVEISVVATSSSALSVITGAGSILETLGAAFFLAAAFFFFGALLRALDFAAFLTDFAFLPFESLACFPLLLALAFAILISFS